MSNTLPKKHIPASESGRLTSSAFSLSPEESRIVRNAKAQFERRGGFVRIFPAADTWAKYSQYLGKNMKMNVN